MPGQQVDPSPINPSSIMKRYLLALITLPVLLGGCSSPNQSVSQRVIPTGTVTSSWGERPSYRQYSHHFDLTGRHPVNAFDSKVDLEVLVNADGTVQDVAILESSGNAMVDRVTVARFMGARYSLKLEPTDPAPHVVRQLIEYKTESSMKAADRWYIDATKYSDLGPLPN